MSGQDIKDFLPEEDTCQLCISQFYDFHFKLRLLKVAVQHVIRLYSRTARVADEMSNEVHFACISLTRKKEVKLATGL